MNSNPFETKKDALLVKAASSPGSDGCLSGIDGGLGSVSDYNKSLVKCQVNSVSVPFGEFSEIEKKFYPKKVTSSFLASSYSRLGYANKADAVENCGSFLQFAHPINPEDGSVSFESKLYSANFCRDRLCPMCAWRRSYKIFGQCSRIMELIGSQYDFVFVTFTVRSVEGSKLSETISRMLQAYFRMVRRKAFTNVVCGFFRALEITRNNDTRSKSYGLYHPHFHCVFAVRPSYWHKEYLNHSQWLNLWRDVYGDELITQVDVRRAYQKESSELDVISSLSSSVAEIAKYSVKASDYIFPADDDLTDSIVFTLSEALYNRRLTAYGGCFKEAFQKLQMDDAEDGDLVHLNDKIDSSLAYMICNYHWNCGAYTIGSCFIKSPEKGGDSDG